MFEIFRKHKLSKLVLVFVVVMVFLVIPLTIIQVQQQQEIRQRALSLSPVSLSMDAPATAEVNKPFTVTINLNNTQGKDISGFDITIAFAKELVLSDFDKSTSSNFSIIIKDQSVPETFRLVGVNPSLGAINAPVIQLGKMEFTAAKTLISRILFGQVSVTGAGGLSFSDALNNLPAVSASVEIISSPTTPTPTPTSQCGVNDCGGPGACAVGSSCIQNPQNNQKDCTCQSSQPTSTPTAIPTPTPTPVPTPIPGSTLLALSVKVPGIGTVPPENLPRTKSRPVTVIVRTTAGDIEKKGVIEFFVNDGTFKTNPKRPVDLGLSIPTNTLDLVIKVDFFKGFVSDVALSQGPNQPPPTPTLQVGLDDNGNVDAVSYFNALVSCFGEKSCTNKLATDLNDDGSVDGIDFNIFLKSIKTLISR